MDTPTETTAPTPEVKKGPPVPRGPSPENQKRLDHIVARANKEPGVPSPTIAKELNMSTLQLSQLADRLVRKGKIVLVKIAGGVRTYYPEGYVHVAPKAASDVPAETLPATDATVAPEEAQEGDEESLT